MESFLTLWLRNWPGMSFRDEQSDRDGNGGGINQAGVSFSTPEDRGVCKNTEIQLDVRSLAQQLYREKIRRPEIIRQLSEDLELGKETVKEYMTFFNFEHCSALKALRMLLRVLWPADELELQHLFTNQFSYRYVLCTGQDFRLQISFYYLTWSLIMLNADLNGGHKGRKMTRKEFTENVNHVGRTFRFRYKLQDLEYMYDSVKRMPLKARWVRTRGQEIHKRGGSPSGKRSREGQEKKTESSREHGSGSERV